MNYEKQANDFLKKHQTTMDIEFIVLDKHFNGDQQKRDIYQITLKRGTLKFTFRFGQSIVNSGNYHYYHKGMIKLVRENYNVNSFNYGVKFINGTGWKRNKRKKPTAYNVLACLQKYNPGTFDDFCSDFGYDNDSRIAEKTYKAVVQEYLQLSQMFTENEMEAMAEIQ